MAKPTLYLETSVVSYLTARPSRDVVVRGHQKTTGEFWRTRLDQFDVFISRVVVDEAAQGDPDCAEARLSAIAPFPLLPVTPDAERLAEAYRRRAALPADAFRDSLHIALAAVHNLGYLITWNCSHIAGAAARRKIAEINRLEGVGEPMLCTPEELMED